MAKRKMLRLTTTLGVASALALIIGVASSKGILPKAHAGEDSRGKKGCSVATLQGDYLYSVRQDSRSDLTDPRLPLVAAGVRAYDGEGNLFQVGTVSRGGAITQHEVATGTYTLDSDCTGTMTIEAPGVRRHVDIFVATDGSEGAGIRTDDGLIQSQTFKRP